MQKKHFIMERDYSYPRWEQKLESYNKALRRLAEIVNYAKQQPLSDFEKDALVKRFEYTHEMAWKLMMSYCKFTSPEDEVLGSRDSTRWAFSRELITDGQAWMDMIKSRNSTAHNYDGDVADEVIMDVIDRFFPLMVQFFQKMSKLSSNTPEDLFN